MGGHAGELSDRIANVSTRTRVQRKHRKAGEWGRRGTRLKVARTVVRVLQHDSDFSAAFLGFRSSLQTFAGRAMLRTADAHKKILEQLQTDAAERRRHAQGGGGRLFAATGCNVKPAPFAVNASQMYPPVRASSASIGRQGNGGGEVHVSRLRARYRGASAATRW